MSRLRLKSVPRRARLMLRLGASGILLVAVAYAVDGEAMLDRLAGADAGWLVAAGAALTLQTVLSAFRWRLTAARLQLRMSFGRAVSEYYLGQLVNQTLPGGVVGDIGRAARARHAGGLFRAGQTVVLERLAGQVILVAVALVAVTTTALVPGGVTWPKGTAAGIPAAVVAAAMLAALAARTGVARRLPKRVARLGDQAWHALAARGVRWRQAALSLGTVACNIAAFAFCARATGTDLSIGAAASVVPIVLLAMLVPLGVSGWGFREGAASALWPIAGGTAAAGAAASIAFGATLLVASLPGLLPLLAGLGGAADAPRT